MAKKKSRGKGVTFYLRPEDREAMERMRKHLHVTSTSEMLRRMVEYMEKSEVTASEFYRVLSEETEGPRSEDEGPRSEE